MPFPFRALNFGQYYWQKLEEYQHLFCYLFAKLNDKNVMLNHIKSNFRAKVKSQYFKPSGDFFWGNSVIFGLFISFYPIIFVPGFHTVYFCGTITPYKRSG